MLFLAPHSHFLKTASPAGQCFAGTKALVRGLTQEGVVGVVLRGRGPVQPPGMALGSPGLGRAAQPLSSFTYTRITAIS